VSRQGYSILFNRTCVLILTVNPGHRYHSRAEYLADIELIATNCEQYNGSDTRYTRFAKKILHYAQTQLEVVCFLLPQRLLVHLVFLFHTSSRSTVLS